MTRPKEEAALPGAASQDENQSQQIIARLSSLTAAHDHETAVINIAVRDTPVTDGELHDTKVDLSQAILHLNRARRYVRRIRLERLP